MIRFAAIDPSRTHNHSAQCKLPADKGKVLGGHSPPVCNKNCWKAVGIDSAGRGARENCRAIPIMYEFATCNCRWEGFFEEVPRGRPEMSTRDSFRLRAVRVLVTRRSQSEWLESEHAGLCDYLHCSPVRSIPRYERGRRTKSGPVHSKCYARTHHKLTKRSRRKQASLRHGRDCA